MAMSSRRRQSIDAVGAVVLGTATSAVVNVTTSDPTWATVTGLVVVTAAFAALEGWRARKEAGNRALHKIDIKTKNVDNSEVIGAVGAHGATDMDIRLRTGDLTDGSRVTGYEQR